MNCQPLPQPIPPRSHRGGHLAGNLRRLIRRGRVEGHCLGLRRHTPLRNPAGYQPIYTAPGDRGQ